MLYRNKIMSEYLQYRNYIGDANVDLEKNILTGKVLNVIKLIAYEGETVKELRDAFEKAIDKYISEFNIEEGLIS